MNPQAGEAFYWVIAAGAVIWLGIGCYLAMLAARQRSLVRRLRQLEQIRNDEE